MTQLENERFVVRDAEAVADMLVAAAPSEFFVEEEVELTDRGRSVSRTTSFSTVELPWAFRETSSMRWRARRVVRYRRVELQPTRHATPDGEGLVCGVCGQEIEDPHEAADCVKRLLERAGEGWPHARVMKDTTPDSIKHCSSITHSADLSLCLYCGERLDSVFGACPSREKSTRSDLLIRALETETARLELLKVCDAVDEGQTLAQCVEMAELECTVEWEQREAAEKRVTEIEAELAREIASFRERAEAGQTALNNERVARDQLYREKVRLEAELARVTEERDEARSGYHALDKNWEVVHGAAMGTVRKALALPDGDLPAIDRRITELTESSVLLLELAPFVRRHLIDGITRPFDQRETLSFKFHSWLDRLGKIQERARRAEQKATGGSI